MESSSLYRSRNSLCGHQQKTTLQSEPSRNQILAELSGAYLSSDSGSSVFRLWMWLTGEVLWLVFSSLPMEWVLLFSSPSLILCLSFWISRSTLDRNKTVSMAALQNISFCPSFGYFHTHCRVSTNRRNQHKVFKWVLKDMRFKVSLSW